MTTILGGFALIAVLGSQTRFPIAISFIAAIVANWLTGRRWSEFCCPRCGAAFFQSHGWGGGVVNVWRNACAQCGLRTGASEAVQ